MKKFDLGQSITVLANIGVIAGIVFLAVEVNQNTNMMRAQTRDAMTERLMNWYTSISSNPYTATTFDKGNSGQDLDQSSGEEVAYLFMALGNLKMWENELYQYQLGLFDEEEFLPRKALWKTLFKGSYGYRRVWQEDGGQFSPDFTEVINQIISEIEAEEASEN